MASSQHRKSELVSITSTIESGFEARHEPPPAGNINTSSSSMGFFQDPPKVPNQALDDISFRRAFKIFLPPDAQHQLYPHLTQFGAKVLSPRVLAWGASAENNPPTVQTHDSFGRPKNELITSEGWRQLQELGIREGAVALGYEGTFGELDRVAQFLKYYLWAPSSALVTCPSAMQDGAAALMRRYLYGTDSADGDWMTDDVKAALESAYQRLTNRDPALAWTSGQWMTERPGGSDVRNTETRATFAPDAASAATEIASDGSALGPWRIDGFKWFSSATDADMAVLLAKTGATDATSLFFAPTRKRSRFSESNETAFNGISLHRLKSKLGTRQLPTAELDLRDLRAHMLGRPGAGTKEISTVLNITRVHNAVSAVSGWGRALSVSRAWARVRRTSGKLLSDIPLHVKGMAAETVKQRAYTLFAFFTVTLLGVTEHDSLAQPNLPSPQIARSTNPLLPSSHADAAALFRLFTPVLKATSALEGIAGIRFAMESLGGVGYLENSEPELNLARAFRDANVLAIWEGTTDVMASDTVRVLKGRAGAAVLAALSTWLDAQSSRWGRPVEPSRAATVLRTRRLLEAHMAHLRALVAQMPAEELTYHARELLRVVPILVCSVLLVADALSDGDAVAWKVAERWVAMHEGEKAVGGVQGVGLGNPAHEAWREDARWDRAIVFGEGEEATARL